MDDNAIANAHLKRILLEQIRVQEKANSINKRILRRISIVYMSVSILIVMGIMFLIYIVSKPESKANLALKEMNSLNTRISLQREYIEMDRKDLESIREDLNELIKFSDSINIKKYHKK